MFGVLFEVGVIWDFGCPNEGKGVWDGLGGFIKACAARDILYGKVTMKSAHDFYLWAHKWAATWRAREDAAVSEFIVLWVGKENQQRLEQRGSRQCYLVSQASSITIAGVLKQHVPDIVGGSGVSV